MELFLLTCWKFVNYIPMWVSIWALYSVPLGFLSILLPIPCNWGLFLTLNSSIPYIENKQIISAQFNEFPLNEHICIICSRTKNLCITSILEALFLSLQGSLVCCGCKEFMRLQRVRLDLVTEQQKKLLKFLFPATTPS